MVIEYLSFFILGSILKTGEQNGMSKARRLFGIRKRRKMKQRLTMLFIKINITTLLVVIFTSGFHQMKGKIVGYIVAQFICPLNKVFLRKHDL